MSDEDEDDNPVLDEDVPYLGEYKGDRNENGQRHGFGRALLPNMDTYTGWYENNKRHGVGTYIFNTNGARYGGDWERNYKHGKGIFIFPDGSRYEGNFVANKKHGDGKYTYINGDIYEGEWRNDLRHGYGTYTFKESGAQYFGTWRHGKMDGYGDMVYNSLKFCGQWKDGVMFGSGKYVFPRLGYQQRGEYVKKEEPTEEDEGVQQVEDAAAYYPTRWKCSELGSLITDDAYPDFDEGEIETPKIPSTPVEEIND